MTIKQILAWDPTAGREDSMLTIIIGVLWMFWFRFVPAAIVLVASLILVALIAAGIYRLFHW